MSSSTGERCSTAIGVVLAGARRSLESARSRPDAREGSGEFVARELIRQTASLQMFAPTSHGTGGPQGAYRRGVPRPGPCDAVRPVDVLGDGAWRALRGCAGITGLVVRLDGAIHQVPTLRDAARIVGCSTRSLHRVFKRLTGTNFRTFRTDWVMTEARRLFGLPNASVRSVASTLGYRYPENLERAYAEYWLETPWRRPTRRARRRVKGAIGA